VRSSVSAIRPVLGALLPAFLVLSACQQAEPLALPAAGTDRAATCAVVAAAEARRASGVQAEIPIEAQGRILHYALLEGAKDGEFSGEAAGAVNRRMGELEASVTGGKWQGLAPACLEAFPATAASDPALPKGTLDAQLGCDELAGFMMTALERQKARYGNELAEYRLLRQGLEQKLAPGLRARAGADRLKQQAVRREALSAIAKAGSPVPLLRLCVERYG
jgi:hypothetical protein